MCLDELAREACFSKYHFHRLFHTLTNETLFAFIQRLRVEKAAALLLNSRALPITQISYECGFSGPSAFARAFRERFNMTATQWRNARKSTYSREKIRAMKQPCESPHRDQCKDVVGEVLVQDLPETILAYIRYTGRYEGDADLFARLYKKLFAWADPRDLVCKETKYITVYHDSIDITAPEKLRISAAIKVPPGTQVSGVIGKMRLEKGRYACAGFRLGHLEYYRAWQWVFAAWLPQSGYQPADGPCFEYYPDLKSKEKDGKMDVQICVPVVPL